MILFVLFIFGLCNLANGAYCTCGPTQVVDSNLGYVHLESLTETSDCPGKAGPQDLTNFVAFLTPGVTYELTYNVTKCGNTQYDTLSGAWIDYDQDEEFETSESLFSFSTKFGLQSHRFTVPFNALNGKTRMRVMVQETATATLYPCSLFAYGGTKDFTATFGTGGCPSGPTQQLHDTSLGAVALQGVTSTINDNSNGCPGVRGVQDFTKMVADLKFGGTYRLNSTIVSCGNTFPLYGGAWIDFDRNGKFEETERIVSYSLTYGFSSQLFKVPSSISGVDIPSGPAFLRVQVQETFYTSIDACALFAWGATKDYTVNLIKP